jgi:hypothetical protein
MAEKNHEEGTARVDVPIHQPSGWFRYIPLFLFVLILYLIGKSLIADPRSQVGLGAYHLSWVEVLLVVASVAALLEQMKVSHPGIDNTIEALGMIGMGVLQLMLFIMGAASIKGFGIFNNTEFLVLAFISLVAAVIAVLINARTLRRTIGVGDN